MTTGTIAQTYYSGEYRGIITGTVIAQTYYKESYVEEESWKSGRGWSPGGSNAEQNIGSKSYDEGENCWGNEASGQRSEQRSEQNTETYTEKESYGEDYREVREESWTKDEKTNSMGQYSNSEHMERGYYVKEYHEDYREENYWKARENYLKARQEYLNSKDKYGVLENEVVFQNAKDYLSCGCSLIENWLGKLRTYIETSDLTEEEKENLTAELDDHIGSFEEYRNSILNARTPDEIRKINQKLRDSWLEARTEARSLAGKTVCFRLNKVIQRAEHVEMRLESRIALLNQSGYDTAELEALLQEYSQSLDAADWSLNSALELYENGSWDDCKEAELHVKTATNHIKTAFNTIKEFLTEFGAMQSPFFYGDNNEVWIYSNYGN
jgi:exonuclease VII small subunit